SGSSTAASMHCWNGRATSAGTGRAPAAVRSESAFACASATRAAAASARERFMTASVSGEWACISSKAMAMVMAARGSWLLRHGGDRGDEQCDIGFARQPVIAVLYQQRLHVG